MASTDRTYGYSGVLYVDGTQVTGLREFTLTSTVDKVDSTAGSEASKSYVPTLRDATGSFKYIYEAASGTSSQPHNQLMKADGTLRSFQYGPAGSRAGTDPCDAGSMFISSRPKTVTYEGLIEWTVDFQVTGDLVKESETDVW